MNWDAIGAVGEITGALGVLVSLIYVAVQIRKNTRALERESHQSLLQQQHAVMSLKLDNDELYKLVDRGESDPDQLSPEEWKKFVQYAFMYVNVWENTFQNYKSNNMDAELFDAWDTGCRKLYAQQGYKRFWNENNGAYTRSFAKHVGDYFEELD